jgi:hypothetical protein
MLTTYMREKFGTIVVGGIIGVLALAFGLSGILSPKATRGMHEGAVAGTVNGDPISVQEFQRSYNQRLDFFKQMGGGKISDEQLKQFHVKGAVFQDLVRRKLMIQEAYRSGLTASDNEVKEEIQKIPSFLQDGKFDISKYKELLQANGYSPGGFERTIREDLSAQRWELFFKRRARVSDDEAKQEFLVTRDKRNIKYVLLTNENGRKGLQISPEAIKKLLADPGKAPQVLTQYESRKATQYKGKSFDDVKEQIAREMLVIEQLPQIQKINSQVADTVLSMLKADKGSDAAANAYLKTYGAEVKSTGLVTQANPYLPGVGEAKELMGDAFAAHSPIDPTRGGKAKKYTSGAWTLVAIVEETQKPDLAKFDSERESILGQLSTRKERELFDTWLKAVSVKAKIEPNLSIVGDESEEG